MTTYAQTATVAHVLEFTGRNGEWQTLCGRGRRHNYRYGKPPDWRMDLRDRPIRYRHPDVKQWEIGSRWSDEPPTKPWCSQCRSRVEQLARDLGLIP